MSNSSDICDKIAEIRLGNKKILVSETENENGGLFSYAEQNGKVLMAINKSFGSIGAQKQNPDGGRLYPSYTSDYYDKILKSKTDILGKKILVQKGDPSYEKVVDLLPPLQEAYTFLGDKEYHYRPLPRIDWNGSIGGNGFLGFGLNGKPIEYGSVKHSLLDGYLPAIQFIYLNEKEQIGWEEIAFARAYPEHENIMLVFIRLKVRNLSERARKENISIFFLPYYLSRDRNDTHYTPYLYPEYDGSPDKEKRECLWISDENNHQKGEMHPFGFINRMCQCQGGEEKSFYLTLAYPRLLKEGIFEHLGPNVNFYGALFETKWDWDRFLKKRMQIETPETRVNNACKATLIQSFMTVVDSDVKYAAAGIYSREPHLDGLPIAIIHAAESFSEWGYSKEVGRYLAYYLKHYINPDGTVTYKQGTGAYDYGLLLYAISRYYRLSNSDADWVRQNILPIKKICSFIVQKRKESLRSNPADSVRHGLLPTSLGDDLNYMGDNSYNYAHDACCWLGLGEVGKMMLETGRKKSARAMSAYGKELVDFAESYKRDIITSIKKSINSDGNPIFVPIYPGDNKPFPSMTSGALANYSNYLYYPSLLYANIFSADISSAVIEFREKRGGAVLGTSRFMTRLDDWPIAKLGWALINLDMVEKFLLTYYSDLAHHRMREIFTAYEQVGINDEGKGRIIIASHNICSTLATPRMTKYMLVFEERDKDILWLNRASPRRWLEDGKKIVVRNAPTRWGKISYCVESHTEKNHISARIDIAGIASKSLLIKLRLRHPDVRQLSSVIVDGDKWRDVDQEKETIDIPCRDKKKIIINACYD
jgi:hypothetical protein